MSAEDAFTVRPLQAGDTPAWLHFFDHVAFADNPRWAGCFCQYPTVDHEQEDWAARPAEANRQRACQRLARGEQTGAVALDAGGAVVGWCHAGPWQACTIMDDASPEPLAPRLAAVTCFVIAPAWRGRGVARALLAEACRLLQAQGFEAVDGWTSPEATTVQDMHTGPRALYESLGFERLREVGGRWVMRRRLG